MKRLPVDDGRIDDKEAIELELEQDREQVFATINAHRKVNRCDLSGLERELHVSDAQRARVDLDTKVRQVTKDVLFQATLGRQRELTLDHNISQVHL